MFIEITYEEFAFNSVRNHTRNMNYIYRDFFHPLSGKYLFTRYYKKVVK